MRGKALEASGVRTKKSLKSVPTADAWAAIRWAPALPAGMRLTVGRALALVALARLAVK